MTKKSTPNINQKLAKLDQAIDWFYGDEFTLAEASAKYQATTALAQSIEQDLAALKNEIKLISQDFTKD